MQHAIAAIRYGSAAVEKAMKMFPIFTTTFPEFFRNLIFPEKLQPQWQGIEITNTNELIESATDTAPLSSPDCLT